jgi:signal peptidase I
MYYKQNGDKDFITDIDNDKIDSETEIDDSVSNSDVNDFYIEEPYDATEQVEGEVEKRTSVKSFLFDLLFYAILIFVSVYIIPNFILQRTIVDGISMENTLSDGDHLYVEKVSYRMNMLDRFDIIVFYPFGRDNEEYYVKRIIGLPGETIQIIDSIIYINSVAIDDQYGKDPILDPGRAADPIVLAEDEYFVMGDNRNISKDSRYSVVGNVKKKNIGGKAFFRISPLKELGPID